MSCCIGVGIWDLHETDTSFYFSIWSAIMQALLYYEHSAVSATYVCTVHTSYTPSQCSCLTFGPSYTGGCSLSTQARGLNIALSRNSVLATWHTSASRHPTPPGWARPNPHNLCVARVHITLLMQEKEQALFNATSLVAYLSVIARRGLMPTDYDILSKDNFSTLVCRDLGISANGRWNEVFCKKKRWTQCSYWYWGKAEHPTWLQWLTFLLPLPWWENVPSERKAKLFLDCV